MIINEILSEFFKESSYRSYVLFETLILEVLSEYFKDKDKKLITNFGTQNPFIRDELDAISLDDFDNYHGATVFEIKSYRNKHLLINLKKTYAKLLLSIKQMDLNIRNIIFIISLDLDKEEKSEIVNRLKEKSNLRIEIWDTKDLQTLFDKYPNVVSRSMKNISKIAVNNQVNKSINNEYSDLLNEKKQHISNLKQSFHKDKLVLFLGAGASRAAKIPAWNNLISGLLVSLLSELLKKNNIELSSEEKNYIVKELKESNQNSALLLAQYAKCGLQDLFTTTITHILYKSCISESSLLTALSKLCKPLRSRIGIQGVINYNFDDLVEYNFSQHDINYHAVYQEADVPAQDELGIYHVHGFLPREREKYTDLNKSLLVFSEKGYHDLMLDPYNWANLVQLNYLRENTCLFIGLSLTDPNLRRLLDISARKAEDNNPKHFAILKRKLFHEEIISASNIDSKKIKKFDLVNQQLLEEYYKELSLNIIWVDSFDEIPKMLDELSK
ncbi:SIR2 family protein [Sporolactobacillus sp. KGMB 08714]|uniref:SIR2 family protein n=1 Tax=Sporolactobacillus sp. KGMB 08714 TaxID=3064704 RepID=UPI002FBE9983